MLCEDLNFVVVQRSDFGQALWAFCGPVPTLEHGKAEASRSASLSSFNSLFLQGESCRLLDMPQYWRLAEMDLPWISLLPRSDMFPSSTGCGESCISTEQDCRFWICIFLDVYRLSLSVISH